MSVLAGEICTCMCHDPDMEVHHCMPCCHQCPHCGFNIAGHSIESHEERCRKDYEELGLPLNQHHPLSMVEEIDLEVLRDLKKAARGSEE